MINKQLSIRNFIFIALFFFMGNVYAGIGSAGAQFMQISSGSRAPAMGSAYVAYANGLDAIYWNPAGLTSLSDKSYLSVTHLDYFADMNFENIAYATPFMDGFLGFSLISLLSGDIEITTLDQPKGTGETYSANEFAFSSTYSKSLTNKFSLGISFKVIYQELAELSARGWAMDVGATYNTGLFNDLRFGFAVTNFGPDMRYNGDDLIFQTRVNQGQDAQDEDARAELLTQLYQLPLKLQVGIAIDVINEAGQKMTATIDGINPADYPETFALGLEYMIQNRYYVRAGFSNLYEKGFTAGIGAKFDELLNLDIVVNYGFELHDYLGELHRIGADLSF